MSIVTVVLRFRHPNGSRSHHTAVTGQNGRLKPFWGMVGSEPKHLPSSVYYLRYRKDGRRVWERTGTDPVLTLTLRVQREHQLQGARLGLGFLPDPGTSARTAPSSKLEPEKRLPLFPTIHAYVSDVEMLHGKKTASDYSNHLTKFADGCKKSFIDQLSRDDVRDFIKLMISARLEPKTIHNRLTTLKAFLRKNGQDGSIVDHSDAPRVHQVLPHVYTRQQVTALLAASTPEQRLVWEVFLASGLREQELACLGWEDVLFERGMLHLHKKPDLKFTLKSYEERRIPLPAELVTRLKDRRDRRPKDRLVFPTACGKPNGHLLRCLKKVAHKAGLNCGLCIDGKGRSCTGKAICSKWLLHSFRRTAGTRWHEAGVSVPTVQKLLGHADIETTMRYLSGQDLDAAELRQSMDQCFSLHTA